MSAWVHWRYEWIYAATWVFISVVWILAGTYLEGSAAQGVGLGILLLNYTAAGFMLARLSLKAAGPSLSAAAWLSVVVPVLTWASGPVTATALAIHRPVFLAYAALALALAFLAARLRQVGQSRWAWPLYAVAVIDMTWSYLLGLGHQDTAIGLSAVFALVALAIAWLERSALAGAQSVSVPTYLGLGFIFVGHFYVLDQFAGAGTMWPAYTALLAAAFILLALTVREGTLGRIYGTPLRPAGMVLLVVPLVYTLLEKSPLVGALTFAVAGLAFGSDAAAHRSLRGAHLAAAIWLGVLWWLLAYFQVRELQAYAIPLGLGLLVVGWSERRHSGYSRILTIWGLTALLGSAFTQSLLAPVYALLLLVESTAALAWGVRTRSRDFVRLGGLALVANAAAQVGPSLVELPRWIQLAVTGGLLLGGGLLALVRREEFKGALRTRHHVEYIFVGSRWRYHLDFSAPTDQFPRVEGLFDSLAAGFTYLGKHAP